MRNEIFWTLSGQILGELYTEPHKRRELTTEVSARQIQNSGLEEKFPNSDLKDEWNQTLYWLQQNGFVRAEGSITPLKYSITSRGLAALGVDLSEYMNLSDTKTAGQILSDLRDTVFDEGKRALVAGVVQRSVEFAQNFIEIEP